MRGPLVIRPEALYFFVKERRYQGSTDAVVAKQALDSVLGAVGGALAGAALERIAGAPEPLKLGLRPAAEAAQVAEAARAEAPEVASCPECFTFPKSLIRKVSIDFTGMLAIATDSGTVAVNGASPAPRVSAYLKLRGYPFDAAERGTKGVGAFCALLAAIGLAFLLGGVYMFAEASRASGWPTTEGSVTSAGIGERWAGADGQVYRPEVEYRYAVDGREFTGRRISVDPPEFMKRELAEKRLEKYRAGGRVRVRYDPAKPAESLLEDTTTKFPHLLVAVGSAVLLATGLVFRASRR